MVVVFQSAPPQRPQWMDDCLASVQQWAAHHGFDYRFIGDELFDQLPQSYRSKVADRGPILADLGRLQLLQNHLQREGGQALWLDADTLCVDIDWLPSLAGHSLFGEECWVQKNNKDRWQRYITPHNAFLAFTAGSPILPFLSHATESIISRADTAHIAPQMVGPKLIKALHNLAPFCLLPAAGALSPALISELTTTPAEAVACYQQGGREPLAMVNLCASLAMTADDHWQRQRLADSATLLSPITDLAPKATLKAID